VSDTDVSRREFMQRGAGVAVALTAATALPATRWMSVASRATKPVLHPAKGILVLVTLYGGNDGLNTVIPYQDAAYLGGRPTLGYQPNEVLPIGDGLALHPSLTGLKNLWDAHQLAIVRGVGYPNPNRSHFRSMDIWQSGVPNDIEPTGWLGRWLDKTGTDPLRALSIGPNLPRVLAGNKTSGAAIPTGSLRLPGQPAIAHAFAALEHPYTGEPRLAARAAQTGADLLHVQAVLTKAISTATARAPATPPATGPLGTQLDLVARTINAHVPTRVYATSLSGFDTHADEKATQARLLSELDTSITRFLAALEPTRAQHVVIATYSEFGRRVAANASGGTDHGTAAPLFIIGPSIKGGFYGDEPALTNLDNGDLRYTTDFRSVYATLLADVIGVNPDIALRGHFPTLPLI
jgi:uncharacterized protein (DUF1501 family)